ncbi:hypothetical protein [Victivallis vadensis]|uniref:hypothetical protein n=1 Tax=Victivallis vadensis TaxID=172901 RepID=UPI003CFF1E81
MIKAKKPVISNFLPVGEYYSRPAKSFSFGDVKIQTYQTDHSPIWKEFVMVSEISIETGGERCIILHSGDTWDAKMLRPMKNKPDFWFVHPRIHLSVREGRTRLHPKTTLVAHLWVHSDW